MNSRCSGLGSSFRHCVIAHGHVVEVPDKPSTPLNHLINKFIGADRIQILAGVAAGQAEGQMLLLQDCHCLNHFLVGYRCPGGPSVADSKPSTLMAGIIYKFFTRSISFAKASSINVALVKERNWQSLCFSHRAIRSFFANQRLTAGIYVHIYAHFLAPG